MTTSSVSSPIATGGAGTFFEQHVDAYWLALLLVRATPPILLDCTVEEVRLQTELHGWHTDDFLVVCQNGAGATRKLAGQVKSSFTLSASDDDCKKVITDFWRDFRASDRFSPPTDRLALVIQRGSNALLGSFATLLDSARASRDAAEFEQRLSTKGFLAAKSVEYCTAIRTIVGAEEGAVPNVAEIWPFLRVLHLLSLDLYTSTAQHEGMIKTLLAHTTSEPDPNGVAGASWNELLVVAEKGMAQAQSFGLGDLPEKLRQRHSTLGGAEQQVLRKLAGHTKPVLDHVKSSIGANFHLQRAALVQTTITSLESERVVILSAPAGTGKSAIAKDALALMSANYFTFAFRAEELAQPHFDATLQAGQIPANTETLQAILAGQDRTIVLIDSVERLLEKPVREAFSDLLRLSDKNIKILLTCRDYSTTLVRDCFLVAAGLQHHVVDVPALSDAELSEVEIAHAALSRPLTSPTLRAILRNPYFLDKALQISWAHDRPLPDSEREFRALFWQQIVRVDHQTAGGMPQRREDTFEEISLRRARALNVYVPSTGMDAAAVASLRHDSLITSSEKSPDLVATAHDVLEDWAILHWIERQPAVRDGSFHGLSAIIGAHPAVRRAYRKWVAELLDRDPSASDGLFQATVVDVNVSVQFRDDTLVSLLRAPAAAEFLDRNSGQLLANDQALFRRVIHLLRVACVTAPAWLPASKSHNSLFNVPEGSAWGAVLQLVHTHFGEFAPKDKLLLVGLIEDWARSVAWWSQYPEGSAAAAAIAHSLLPGFAADREDTPGRRIMKVIAKIPLAAVTELEALMRGANDDEWNRASEEFRGVIFEGMEGTAAGRDVPDLLIETALDYLLCQESDLRSDRHYGSSLEREVVFGLREGLRHDYFPASAFRGPWIQLLNSHPSKGVDFFIKVFNHSIDWYAHPRVHEPVEPPFEVELAFADGTKRRQWTNGTLWCWYRGITSGPYVLQSLLMAFERWLLDYGKKYSNTLDDVLLDILRRSDSAALTAVAASVATALPFASGEALLVLLSSPDYIRVDRQRLAAESSAPSRLPKLFPSRAEHQVYDAERKEADAQPHRQYDLEGAILNLQFGALAARVQVILDGHRAALSPIEGHGDAEKTWRLALHRMDLRRYALSKVQVTPEAPSTESAPAPPREVLQLTPKELEPDVQELVIASAERLGAMNTKLSLMMWGYRVFRRESGTSHDATAWREHLHAAQMSGAGDSVPDEREPQMVRGGPGLVAAVCVRDHWDELSGDEQAWCVQRVCEEVVAHAATWDGFAREQSYEMGADRACASVLPALLGKTLDAVQLSAAETAFASGLTHPVRQVQQYFVWGVAEYLWKIDAALALRCVNALAFEATLIEKSRDLQEQLPYKNRRRPDELAGDSTLAVRGAFWHKGGVPSDAFERLDVTAWFGAWANALALIILSTMPEEQVAISGFARAAKELVAGWDADDDRRRGHGRRESNDQAERTIADRLQNFVLQTRPESAELILQPIFKAIDHHDREVHWIIQGIVGVEDGQTNTPQFWFLWKLFAERVRAAKWLTQLDREHSDGREVLSAMFLTLYWKDDVRHWKSLEGHAQNIDQLFEELPPTATVLDDYVRFLYHIGERSLPAAFSLIAKRLKSGDAQQMLKKSNTVFLLEVLLLRYVYGKPMELKRDTVLRDAVLLLLDALVDQGSSAAFRMRDDFVTPLVA